MKENTFSSCSFKFSDDSNYTIVGNPEVVEVPRNIIFMGKDNKEVGKLSWDDGIFNFEGEAEKSAKIFFDFLKSWFPELNN